MLGCITYSLCYFRHPFQDSQKLAIVNSFYQFPDDPKNRISEKMKDLVRIMLTPNPVLRPGVLQIENILLQWDMIPVIELNVGIIYEEFL